MLFQCIWRSLLHHITNQHSWTLSHGYGTNQCLHEPIDSEEDREKPWLCPRKDKQTLQNLASVILNKRLLNNVPYYLNFRLIFLDTFSVIISPLTQVWVGYIEFTWSVHQHISLWSEKFMERTTSTFLNRLQWNLKYVFAIKCRWLNFYGQLLL